MSLNWKEINLILEELSLEGAQIQGAVQSAFDVIIFRIHKKGSPACAGAPAQAGGTKQILISLGSGACRIHETFSPFPKSDKPLRFAQFLNSRIVNGRITEAVQLGDNRIVKLTVKRGEWTYFLYLRLWSNAANFIVTDTEGNILDAMRRLPKRGEVTGGKYQGLVSSEQGTDKKEERKKKREYEIREFPESENDGKSFNQKIDEFYAAKGGHLSLESLREQARRIYESKIVLLGAAIERLRQKEADFSDSQHLKTYGDLILANIAQIKNGDKWLKAEFDGKTVRIELDPHIAPSQNAADYFEQYKKSKNALLHIREEIIESEQELEKLSQKLNRLLEEKNPLVLAKLLKTSPASGGAASQSKKEKNRPGLAFKRGDWLIFVGRDANENDELLRCHVKGNDFWLHARDFHGSYVFIKNRKGKTVPLEVLLDAGHLALFYSKGRNNGEGNLFYTQVKYLRRVKTAGKVKKGFVIPTQEKNLFIKLDGKRLNSLKTDVL